MLIKPLKIDERTFSKLVETLLSMVPHYTPEWTAPPGEAGTALLKIHAFITEMIITRFNQVPRKSFIAFLDMLGIKLLPAQYLPGPHHLQARPGRDRRYSRPRPDPGLGRQDRGARRGPLRDGGEPSGRGEQPQRGDQR